MGKNKQAYVDAAYYQSVVHLMSLPPLVQGAVLHPLQGYDRTAYLALVNTACRSVGASKAQKLAAYKAAWMYWKFHEQGLEPPEPPEWVVAMGAPGEKQKHVPC